MTYDVSSEQFREARSRVEGVGAVWGFRPEQLIDLLQWLERYYEKLKKRIANSGVLGVVKKVASHAHAFCIARCVLGVLSGDPASGIELLIRVAERFGIVGGCEVAGA